MGGRKGGETNITQCRRKLISGGKSPDHSHWCVFLSSCLSVCAAACGVETQQGKMLTLSPAIVWTRDGGWEVMGGLPPSGWCAFKRHFHLRMEDLCVRALQNTASLRRAARAATCYITEQSAFFSLFYCIWLRSRHLRVSRPNSVEQVESFFFYVRVRCSTLARCLPWRISRSRRVVMARNPRCVLGNTLLLSMSQDKRGLSRIYQQWPWKQKSTAKREIRQVRFQLIFPSYVDCTRLEYLICYTVCFISSTTLVSGAGKEKLPVHPSKPDTRWDQCYCWTPASELWLETSRLQALPRCFDPTSKKLAQTRSASH